MNTKNRFFTGGMRLFLAFTMSTLILSLGTINPARADNPPDLVIGKSHIGTFTQGDQGRTYTIKVTNIGLGSTDGSTVTVTDTLPTGLTATAIEGDGWSCTLGTLTCTRNDVLGADDSFPDITLTVNVAADAPVEIVNEVAVSGGGDADETNNTAIDPTTVVQKPDLIITGYQFRNAANNAVITKPSADEAFHIRMTIKNQGGANTGLFYPGVFLDGKPNYGPDHDVFGRVTYFSDYRISPPGTLGFQEGCLYYDPDDEINPLTELIEPERGNYSRPEYNPELAPGTSVDVDVYIGYPQAQYPDEEYDDIREGLPAGIYNIYLYVDPNCSGGEVESNEYNNSFGPISLSVGVVNTFVDVPVGAFAWSHIESIYAAGITGGCSLTPLNYCPNNQVLRSQMAIFLLRGKHGASYTPPPASGTAFNDVPLGTFGAAWIERFAAEGITGGCGGGNFCPTNPVTRSQMAIFLLRAKYGSSYVPPPALGTVFNDVPLGTFGAAWIEKLVADGITAGCGGGNYCPNNSVTRSQMAIFIQRTFNLPLP